MKLVYKIFIPILFVLMAIALFAQVVFSLSLQRSILAEESDEISDQIQGAIARTLPPSSLDQETAPPLDAFKQIYIALDEAKSARAKVWDASGTIVWSDMATLIGTQAAPNETAPAFNGETFSVTVDAAKLAPSEAFMDVAVENFVPMKDSTGRVRYVFETVAPTEILLASVSGPLTVLPYAVLIIGALILLALLIVNRAYVTRPVEKLQSALQAVARGNLDVPVRLNTLDEFGVLAHDFEQMRLGLKSSVEDLKHQEDRYRHIVEFSPQAIGVHRDGKYVFVNNAMVKLLGVPNREALVGESIFRYIHPDDVEVVRNRVRGEVELGVPAPLLEEKFLRMDGTVIDVEVAGTAIVFDGRPAAQVFVTDITERKRIEARSHELDELKNVFIRTVSHQLRTPLNSIRWTLEALLEGQFGPLKKAHQEFVRATYDVDVEVIRRVQDLLMALDIEEGRTKLDTKRVDLRSVLAQAVGTLKKLCADRNIRLRWKKPAKRIPVDVDIAMMREAFERLIDNAMKYTSARGTITLTLETKEGRVRFSCTDTGGGIPAADQSRIFTRFYRASNASVLWPDASGLGLYITKYYVRQHGGTIGFESHEGQGSTFWFEVPLAEA